MISGVMLQAITGVVQSIAQSIQGVSAFLVAVAGIAGTIFGWWKFASGRKKRRDQVNTLLAVGDRFSATAALEGEGYEKAVEQYNKALELDKDNVEIYRRILAATRRKLQLEPAVRLWEPACQAEITTALTRLYEFQTSHAALKDDKALLLEEANLLELGGKLESAVEVLRKAKELHPQDPDVLARLGLLAGDIGLIRRAIEIRGDEASYYYSLAQALDKQGQHAPAIREYRRAAQLASSAEIIPARMRNEALRDLLRIFKAYHAKQGGLLGAELGMPLEERAQALEYFVSSYRTSDPDPHFFLAILYHALGQLEKAHSAMRKALGEDRTWWQHRLPMLRLFARILEEGGFDAATRAEVQAILKEDSERAQYEQVLETGKDKGYRYKVGLRIEKSSGNGVRVLRSFEGYPFAKAGVRDGDRILEFAHREIGSLRDICLPLIEFAPGTDVPLKVQRADELLDLTLIIQ